MTAITTPRLKESSDSLLRFAMRADAILSGLAGIAGIPLAGWLAEISGTTKAFEYSMSAFFIAYGVVVFALAARPSVRTHRHRAWPQAMCCTRSQPWSSFSPMCSR